MLATELRPDVRRDPDISVEEQRFHGRLGKRGRGRRHSCAARSSLFVNKVLKQTRFPWESCIEITGVLA